MSPRGFATKPKPGANSDQSARADGGRRCRCGRAGRRVCGDLLVGERTNFLAIKRDRADQSAFLEHWHDEKGSRATPINEHDDRHKTSLVGRFLPEVRDMNTPLVAARRERGMSVTSVLIISASPRQLSSYVGSPCHATARNVSASRRKRLPNFASQICVALRNIAANTGSSSPGELEMTWSTSEVAVCCSSASVRSVVR
jgi:hypothetical protein